jgi:hypothetical protein
MKKSVRNIVSFITCTCLVASLSAVSISADDESTVNNATVDSTVDNNAGASNDSTANNNATVNNDSTANNNATVNNDSTANNNATVNNDSTANNNATVDNDSTANNNATVDNDSTANNNSGASNEQGSSDEDLVQIPDEDNTANEPSGDSNGEVDNDANPATSDVVFGEEETPEGTIASDSEGSVVTTTIDTPEVSGDGGSVTTTVSAVVTGSENENPSATTTTVATTVTNGLFNNPVTTTTQFNYAYANPAVTYVGTEHFPTYEPVFTSTTEAALKEIDKVITKDVVLTIDTSNSTAGESNDLIKQTAVDLVNKILSEDPDVQISIVGFDGTAHTLEVGQVDEYNMAVTDEYGNQVVDRYFNDADFLTQEIEKMLDAENLGIGTDYYNALNEVKFVLESGDGIDKSVVIMSDGQNSGLFGDLHDRTGNEINDGEYANDSEYLNYDLNEYLQGVVDFANSEIKPMATIYTIGYYQNIEDNPEAVNDSTALLHALASEQHYGVDAPTYYEATEENLDEVTDLIAKDVTYHVAPAQPIEVIDEDGEEVVVSGSAVASESASASNGASANGGSSNGSSTKSNSSSNNSSSNNSSSNASSSDSPKTSDAGVASVIVLAGLAGAMIVVTKKKN